MSERIFLIQGAVTVEVHTQLINFSRNSEREKDIRNHPLIHAALIVNVMNVTVVNQVRDTDVNRRIILPQIFQNRTLRIRKFTGTRKSLKLVHIYRQK